VCHLEEGHNGAINPGTRPGRGLSPSTMRRNDASIVIQIFTSASRHDRAAAFIVDDKKRNKFGTLAERILIDHLVYRSRRGGNCGRSKRSGGVLVDDRTDNVVGVNFFFRLTSLRRRRPSRRIIS
jgi:hypothetical protein